MDSIVSPLAVVVVVFVLEAVHKVYQLRKGLMEY